MSNVSSMVDTELTYLIGTILADGKEHPFVYRISGDLLEIDKYDRMPDVQAKLSWEELGHYELKVRDLIDFPFNEIRMGSYCCPDCGEWIHVSDKAWSLGMCFNCSFDRSNEIAEYHAKNSPPLDFVIHYHWSEGALPPPDHYEYSIHLGWIEDEWRGEIVFLPDYPGADTPEWRESFPVTRENVGRLWHLISDKNILKSEWIADKNIPVGGETEWLEITDDGRTVKVPSRLPDDETIHPIYDAIRSLVPKKIWDDLIVRYDENIDHLIK